VDGPVLALVESPHGGIVIESDDERLAESARLREVSHVASVHDIEHAVGEHEGAGECSGAAREPLGRADLGFECGCGHYLPTYSTTLRTRLTPLGVRAISPAASPSAGETIPIRYTPPASVTTLTWFTENLPLLIMRAFTLDVTSESLPRAASEDA